ncbi:molybdate ABC transporter substrate-binding protein [Pyrobaculum aerophilum]|uniref:ABC transporter substrate-binding protein n=2 Tax=Pyrobaculum aerophilum TaxID=13773 RepID=Q8ZSV2_PYRAE|nr:molybdate ABC transporter substrate-binding protein [Pyrobaculum aerophilum]AAL65011.1 hypothetical protein PAE3569 [Pyrobaculum aerophilum str. IM2]MCX8137105.1 molybdate ABC transporter substrate-binding protein [Pyrobaculum aerophilum]
MRMKTALLIVLISALLIVAAWIVAVTQKPASQPRAAACVGDVSSFVAPTLIRVIKDAVAKAGMSTGGIQSVGSVEGLRKIQAGSRVDLYASVDIELRGDIERVGPRGVFSLGRFKLALACRTPLRDLADLAKVKIALADPNKAPIGYRELAVSWWLQRDYGINLTARYKALGVGFYYNGTLTITVPSALPNTNITDIAPSLDGAWTKLEIGAVDCVYAYVPFLVNKHLSLKPHGEETGYWTAYIGEAPGGKAVYVYVFKPPYDFLNDPPMPVRVVLLDPSGKPAKIINVGHFEAFVASFTEKGDCVLEALKNMNLTAYGFVK